MATHILEIEDIKKDGIVETSLLKSLGKALILRTDIISKEACYVVLDNKEEKIFHSIDDAVDKYLD